MKKTVFAVVLISAAVLACSQNILNFETADKNPIHPVFDKDGYWKTPNFRLKLEKDGTLSYYSSKSLYGAALAAHVAALRHDYSEAAEYYKIILEKNPNNPAINRAAYILLALNGDWDTAAVYAQKDFDGGNKDLLSATVIAAYDFNTGAYAKMRKDLAPLNKSQFYKSFVTPLFDAWSYAAEHQEAAAVKSLNKITDKQLLSLKLAHSGMIYDYLGNTKKADESYKKLLKDYPQEVTYRLMEVMINFYARQEQKDLALQIYNRYNDGGALAILVSGLRQKIDMTDPATPAVINTPQKGLAEAMFNVGTLYRFANNAELAQIYLAASAYLNPNYDITKFALANIYEDGGYYKEANRLYEQIDKDSCSYYIAQLKIIENLNTLKDYGAAAEKLRLLLKDYPDNIQLLNNLADIEREQDNKQEAVKIYKKALAVQKEPNGTVWPIYYALGAIYHQENQHKQAVEYLQKALELSSRNPNVLNYLGYVYLTDGTNTDKAVQMIIDAYSKYPYEGHIIDSLGWVFFRLGQYDKAAAYLEQAADINPANAVICDHLGDAYWFIGRKNEAVYQWQHALVLKEDADAINKEDIQNKIDSGIVENKVLNLTNPKIQERLDQLSSNQ